jgi:hypothetical protein
MTSPLNTDPNATMGNPLYQGALGVNPNATSNTPAMPNFGTTYPTARGDSMADMVYGDDFGSLRAGNALSGMQAEALIAPSGVGGAVPLATNPLSQNATTSAKGATPTTVANPLSQYTVGSTAKGSNIQNILSAQGMKEINPNSTFLLDKDGSWNEMLVSPSSTGGTTGGATGGTTPTTVANPLSTYGTTPTTGTTPAPDIAGMTTGSSSSGSFSQGSALPNVTTVQKSQTVAPSFYTDYLNNLATQGKQAAENAQYVGATDLQKQAWDTASQNAGNWQDSLNSAINLAKGVGDTSLYKAVGDLGEQNIRRNLAPQATAGLVGSGQFGSSRGATALGDTIANAELGLTAQQQQALQQDYINRLNAANSLGTFAGQQSALNTTDINNLATMGQQKQTIAQNEQLFPMQQLANESQLLKGYTIPTSTTEATTAPGQQGQFAMSPLQQIMSIGTLLGALNQSPAKGGDTAMQNLITAISKGGSSLTDYLKSFNSTPAPTIDVSPLTPVTNDNPELDPGAYQP